MYSSGNSFQGGFYNNNNNNNNNNRNNNNNPFNQNQNQNQNNFQNNNQNNNNNAPQSGVVTTKFPVAIGPVTDSNISAILESIQMKLLLASNKTNLNILRLTPSFNFDYEYITLYLENANQITEMININPFYFHDEQIFIAASDSPNDEIYINFVDSIFPDCITGTFLDLSDIERKSRPTHVLDATGIDINLRYSAMPFILFLTVLKCKVLLLITEYISFDNNMLSDSRHLRYFRYFFPYLKKLSISGNFGEVMAYKSEKLAKNIRMNDQNKERLLDFYTKELKSFKKAGVIVEEQTQLTHAKFEDPKNFKNNFGHPGFRQPVLPPREVTQLTDVVVPILTSDQICAENNTVNLGTNTVCYNTITQNEEVHFNKYDFPANAFISSFITDGKSSIPSLVKYYSDNAVFSLTCDSCPPNSPMMYFHQFSTNRANNDTFYHAQGPQAICHAQFQVFGGCFCSIVTSASLSVLASDAFAAVLHGGFQNTEGVAYAFDRTMMIMKNESGFLIVNDHIFIRNARFI